MASLLYLDEYEPREIVRAVHDSGAVFRCHLRTSSIPHQARKADIDAWFNTCEQVLKDRHPALCGASKTAPALNAEELLK